MLTGSFTAYDQVGLVKILESRFCRQDPVDP